MCTKHDNSLFSNCYTLCVSDCSKQDKVNKIPSSVQKNLMEITDTESSDNDNTNTNRYGQKKTERWHRPEIIPSLKEMEKVPIRRSHRISQMQKKENKDMVSQVIAEIFVMSIQQ